MKTLLLDTTSITVIVLVVGFFIGYFRNTGI
jgi:hypothetical protein